MFTFAAPIPFRTAPRVASSRAGCDSHALPAPHAHRCLPGCDRLLDTG